MMGHRLRDGGWRGILMQIDHHAFITKIVILPGDVKQRIAGGTHSADLKQLPAVISHRLR